MDVREILHWVVETLTHPGYTLPPDRPTAAEVHAAIDDAHGYSPPKPALTPEEQAQLDGLLAKQRAADQAKAEAAAGVEDTPAGVGG